MLLWYEINLSLISLNAIYFCIAYHRSQIFILYHKCIVRQGIYLQVLSEWFCWPFITSDCILFHFFSFRLNWSIILIDFIYSACSAELCMLRSVLYFALVVKISTIFLCVEAIIFVTQYFACGVCTLFTITTYCGQLHDDSIFAKMLVYSTTLHKRKIVFLATKWSIICINFKLNSTILFYISLQICTTYPHGGKTVKICKSINCANSLLIPLRSQNGQNREEATFTVWTCLN